MKAENIKIIPLDYAKSVLAESLIFENGDKNKTRPIIFRVYLLKTENRLILVEAGCYSNAANQFLKLIKIFLNRSPHP